jgi:hypothetical protein
MKRQTGSKPDIQSSCPRDFAPTSDRDDEDSKDSVVDLVNDPVVTASKTIEILITRQLDDA